MRQNASQIHVMLFPLFLYFGIGDSLSFSCFCPSRQLHSVSSLPVRPGYANKVTNCLGQQRGLILCFAQDAKDELNNNLLLVPVEKSDSDPDSLDGKRISQDDHIQDKPTQQRKLFRSVVLLNIVAIIWGTQHAVIKTVISDTDPSCYTLLRFGLAALIASPYTPGLSGLIPSNDKIETAFNIDSQTKKAWRYGLELGALMFLGFALQAVGLETTTATRSGFLLYLNVKFVPFFAWLLNERKPSLPVWISAFCAFLGTALLATDGLSIGLNIGDLWSIAAAASSAMFILRLEKASTEVDESSQLNAACLWVVFALSLIWSSQGDLSITAMKDILTSHPLELVYLGGVTTALSNYIQTLAQKDISAERASVIYSLDPVYGAFFSWLILGETLGGSQGYFGAALIILAAGTNALIDFGKETTQEVVNQSDS